MSIEGQSFMADHKGIYHVRVTTRGFSGALSVETGTERWTDAISRDDVYNYAVVLVAGEVVDVCLTGQFAGIEPSYHVTMEMVRAL